MIDDFKYKPTKAFWLISKLLKSKNNTYVISGGQGAGKTISILMLIIDYAHTNEKKRISIISDELSKMKRTVIKDFLDIIADWNISQFGKWNKSENIFTFNNGSFIEFLGLDAHDVGKGMRRDLVYFNEANKIKIEAYRQVASRSKLNIIDFNPDQRFWGHDLITDNNFINLTYKDNEYLPQQEVDAIEAYKDKGYNADGTIKSSVDKFYSEDELKKWSAAFNSHPGDLMFVMAGQTDKVRKQLSELRLEMGTRLGLRDKNVFAPLWVLDFPLLEWDEESQRYHAMHHPFTSPKKEDIAMLDTKPGEVRANAYDMVVNGTEIGGGSIRIHDRELQSLMFKHLGFSPEEAQKQFGFLLDAFEYGAPPHGGIAFGFDRLVSIFAGLDTIRDVIAFPKNNSGRDVMIDTPSTISDEQMKELNIKSTF